MTVRIITGDALEQLALLPAESVHCCVTSPPYYGLRDYGCAGQLGIEASPAEYVAAMVAVFRDVREVLRSGGTLWLNIGDSYSSGSRTTRDIDSYNKGNAGAGIAFRPGNPQKNKGNSNRDGVLCHGTKPKDLIGIPWMLAFALRDDGWWLRQDIIWSKPNPMPESVTDRCTKAHEYLFLLSKSERYYFDAEAIQEASVTGDPRRPYTSEGAWQLDGRPAEQRHGGEVRALGAKGKKTPGEILSSAGARMGAGWRENPENAPLTRNKRSVWTVATAPYGEAHFATFPPALVEPCILAGCPAGGTVLDPFLGAGTTALVADRLGRNCIGIELNPEYAEMARRRVENDAGMFAEVSHADG